MVGEIIREFEEHNVVTEVREDKLRIFHGIIVDEKELRGVLKRVSSELLSAARKYAGDTTLVLRNLYPSDIVSGQNLWTFSLSAGDNTFSVTIPEDEIKYQQIVAIKLYPDFKGSISRIEFRAANNDLISRLHIDEYFGAANEPAKYIVIPEYERLKMSPGDTINIVMTNPTGTAVDVNLPLIGRVVEKIV